MKKLTKYLLLIMAGLFGLSSCTQPDGNIGEWFGSWHLEEIKINGETDEAYAAKANIMINFQGKIFDLAYIDGTEIYGQWSYAGEVLTLIAGTYGSGVDFPHLFNPFPLPLHFPADVEQIEITVTYINGKTMQWQYIDQNGRLITYNWRKYP